MGDDFTIKDSGQRVEFDSGMHRDSTEGKPRYDLLDREGLRRLAMHMGKGATKYGERNWELAASPEELTRFQASAFRHFIQWLDGEVDEDHAAAVCFNIWACEMVKRKLATGMTEEHYEATMADVEDLIYGNRSSPYPAEAWERLAD